MCCKLNFKKDHGLLLVLASCGCPPAETTLYKSCALKKKKQSVPLQTNMFPQDTRTHALKRKLNTKWKNCVQIEAQHGDVTQKAPAEEANSCKVTSNHPIVHHCCPFNSLASIQMP